MKYDNINIVFNMMIGLVFYVWPFFNAITYNLIQYCLQVKLYSIFHM